MNGEPGQGCSNESKSKGTVNDEELRCALLISDHLRPSLNLKALSVKCADGWSCFRWRSWEVRQSIRNDSRGPGAPGENELRNNRTYCTFESACGLHPWGKEGGNGNRTKCSPPPCYDQVPAGVGRYVCTRGGRKVLTRGYQAHRPWTRTTEHTDQTQTQIDVVTSMNQS